MPTATLSEADPLLYEPVKIGPTWQRDPEHPSGWLLPKRTLGWHIVSWQEGRFQHPDGRQWRYTPEQLRFLLWWYALEDDLSFSFFDGVLQRLKGWGKDPMAASIAGTEFVGPCRPDLSGRTVLDPWGNEHPAGLSHPQAWVQIAATSREQTKNTMTLFPSLFTKSCIAEYGIDLHKEIIYADHGARRIEAVTSSPKTMEGARATFVFRNETHHWLSNNDGHEMQAVIDRNATKSADGAARSLAGTNAYEPGEDSVAERDREAYESMVAGTSAHSRMLYDSIEAPPDAPLAVKLTEEEEEAFKAITDPVAREMAEKEARITKTREVVTAIVLAIRGDSTWLDPERIVNAILDPRNPPSRSRRFWYNQIVATEDAWLSPQEAGACVVKKDRPPEERELQPSDRICLGFDGSLSGDWTALVASRMSDGLVQCLRVWDPAEFAVTIDGNDEKGIDRQVVQDFIDFTFAAFDVVAFFGDYYPLESVVDHVRDEWGHKLQVRASVKHPAAFDMRSGMGERAKLFTEGAMRFAQEVRLGDMRLASPEDPEKARQQAIYMKHVTNARNYPNKFGVSIWKGARVSENKIDAAVTGVLARMARQAAIAAGIPTNPSPPRVLSRIR